jgi:CheY-like chemotaxis protein
MVIQRDFARRHQAAPAPKPVVLVVDDDPDVRHFFKHVLHDADYAVETAMDLYEAIERLKTPGIFAVILDMLFVNSGGYSGLDLLQVIRSRPELKDLSVIVVTGFPLNADVVAQIEAREAELWHKPVDPFELINRLHQLT